MLTDSHGCGVRYFASVDILTAPRNACPGEAEELRELSPRPVRGMRYRILWSIKYMVKWKEAFPAILQYSGGFFFDA
ncbi:hypothetical protein DXA96_18415 [Lachnospiraceae bacterium OF09-33XD]|nr:hypothetical protein DXA96_18415 [Lachnospiraceae bacterium OF09-33XD]